MGEKIYGVDIEEKFTPLMVRDAIVICFEQAHKDVLDMMDEFAKWESSEERERFRNMQIEVTVKNAFKDAQVDYENPDKQGLEKAIGKLAELARQFRSKEIVQKHYDEIKRLIDKL